METELDNIKSSISISLGTKNKLRKNKGNLSYEKYINYLLRSINHNSNKLKNVIEFQKFERKKAMYKLFMKDIIKNSPDIYTILFSYNKYNNSLNFVFDIQIKIIRDVNGRKISLSQFFKEIFLEALTNNENSMIKYKIYFKLLETAIKEEINPQFHHKGRFEDYYSWDEEFKALRLPRRTFEEDVMDKLKDSMTGNRCISLIELAEIEQYFPSTNNNIIIGDYSFKIILSKDEVDDIFLINLKIKQRDTKEGHLIKFKLGMGKDKENNSQTHQGTKPHFEIDIYKRKEEAFAANIYFTFKDSSDKALLNYAKGTLVIISKIVERFLTSKDINIKFLNNIIYSKVVYEELGKYEPKLIDALYDCYKNSELIVRQKGIPMILKTPQSISKFLNASDLEPLYLPLLKKVNENKTLHQTKNK